MYGVMNACFERLVGCTSNLQLLLSPPVAEFCQQQGPTISGALFGAGWWFWADACTSSDVKVKVLPNYLPGFVATIALIMINAVRREELESFDAFDEGVFCRSRAWLFLSYVIAFSSVIGAVWVLLAGASVGTGVACLMQVVCILGAALVFFVARTPVDGIDEYSSF